MPKSLNQSQLDYLEGMLDRFQVSNVQEIMEEVLLMFDALSQPANEYLTEISTAPILLRPSDFNPDEIKIWVNPEEFVKRFVKVVDKKRNKR